MKLNKVSKLLVAIIIPQIAGGLGAIVTVNKISRWYASLQKPWFSPPNFVFGPVWTGLYLTMGIALYLQWQKKKLFDPSLRWWWIQLGLNMMWSWLFFGAENPGLALIEIVILWAAICKTIQSLGKYGLILIPYLAWVSFASVLNAAVWWLNR